MSSEVKRYDPIGDDGVYSFNNIEMSNDGEFVLYTDYESLRLSHEETTKQLRALEDAVMYYMTGGGYIMELNEERKKILHQAIQNSRTRKQV